MQSGSCAAGLGAAGSENCDRTELLVQLCVKRERGGGGEMNGHGKDQQDQCQGL